jgi:uncharacterized protein (DUF2384 family)
MGQRTKSTSLRKTQERIDFRQGKFLEKGLPFSSLLQFQWITGAEDTELCLILGTNPPALQKARETNRIPFYESDCLFDAMLCLQKIEPRILKTKWKIEDLFGYLRHPIDADRLVDPIQLLGTNAGLTYLETYPPSSTLSRTIPPGKNGMSASRPLDSGELFGTACSLLGIPSSRIQQVDDAIRKGLDWQSYEKCVEATGLSKAEINNILRLTELSARNQKAAGHLLAETSNRLFRLTCTYLRVLAGNNNIKESALIWLRKPNNRITGKRPIEIMSNAASDYLVSNMFSPSSRRTLEKTFDRLMVGEPRTKSQIASIHVANAQVDLAKHYYEQSRQLRKKGYDLLSLSILPCPICGGKGEHYFETGMELTQVICCTKCGHFGKSAWDDIFKAIRYWNEDR